MNDKSDTQTAAMFGAFATGIFSTLTIVLLNQAAEATTIDDIKRLYAALTVTGCGAIFFALFTVLLGSEGERTTR